MEINTIRPLFPVHSTSFSERFIDSRRSDQRCRSGRVVWCALRQTPRATEPNPELGVVEPETARRPGMIELGTWARGDTVELRWRKLDERKGKKAIGKVGENTTALLRQGKRIPCQLTRP